MENSPEIKNVLANFLGFAMSKSKELDSAIVPGSAVSKNGNNIDYLISKAATEVEQKFGHQARYEQPARVETFDIASTLIPMPSDTPAVQMPVAQAPITRAPEPIDDGQLEFNFVEPSTQTKLILDEIKLLNNRVNSIIRMLEDKKAPAKKTSSKKTLKNQ
jgi:hypothetical protein